MWHHRALRVLVDCDQAWFAPILGKTAVFEHAECYLGKPATGPAERYPAATGSGAGAGSFSIRIAVALNSAVPDFGSVASIVSRFVATSS